MMTYEEIKIGMLLRREKLNKYEPNYIVQVLGKKVETINGREVKLIVIEDPEHPHEMLSQSPALFQPYFEDGFSANHL